MRVPMDEVIRRIATQDIQPRDAVTASKYLAEERLSRLRHPGHVSNDNSPANHPMPQITSLDQPKYSDIYLRQPKVNAGIKEPNEVKDVFVARQAECFGQTTDEGKAASHGDKHVNEAHDVRFGVFQYMFRPQISS